MNKQNYKLLSIIVPCYNEQEAIPIFIHELKKEMQQLQLDLEIIFIDDGSKDKTREVLYRIYNENKSCVRVISLSRNFGKESAMLAGLEHSKGDLIVVMDVDLQDPPHLLKEMIKAIQEEGYDSVATCRINREGEPPIRSFFARKFYKIINKISDVGIVDGARDYRMMTRKVVDSLLDMREYNRFSKGLYEWVGFDTKYIEFANVERVAGETSWSFWKLFKYAIEGIVSFTTAPLKIASILGFAVSFCSLVYMAVIIIKTMFFGETVKGYPSLMCVILLISGIQLTCIGIVGEYLARSYTEIKNRPRYIIKSLWEDDLKK